MAKSNYADKDSKHEDGGIPSHELTLDDPRRHDPKQPGNAATGTKLSLLTDFCSGDWAWKPGLDKFRNKSFCTFKGVPPSAAELYGRRSYSPA